MKIRVTFMTENDKHNNATKEEMESKATKAWEAICAMLNLYTEENEKITLEKCELVEM